MSRHSLIVPEAEILVVVPPFAFANIASLGAHILQARAREMGFRMGILYANLHYAAAIGHYATLLRAPREILAGERLFAATAYGVPPLGYDAGELMNPNALVGSANQDSRGQQRAYAAQRIDLTLLRELETHIGGWVDEVAAAIAAHDFKVVGCTTMFEQTAASVALLNRIKRLRPEIVTIIGGPNCEDVMAEGIASLSQHIDYIFSGESETTFIEFLQSLFAGETPVERIIRGTPLQDLDSLPTPDFKNYYEQLDYYLPEVTKKPEKIEIAYETSRGCWWGQKHHCSFCGLNGQGIKFRAKSPQKALAEIEMLLAAYPYPRHLVQMTDNIMPYAFFKTLLPQLQQVAAQTPTLRIYYEQKANLSLEQIQALMAAGISHIQPGIEALSTSLLRRMNKGTTAAQNIALLRYARAVGMAIDWNILWGFPGDQRQEYEETLLLIRLIHHLQPPISSHHLRIDRFSPYFEFPEEYGISNLRPLPSYAQIMPPHVDVGQIAYHFTADYASFSHSKPVVIHEIEEELSAWRLAWDEQQTHVMLFFGKFRLKELPVLAVIAQPDGTFLLRDTRGLSGTEELSELTYEQASVALAPRRYESTPAIEWAIARKVGIVLDKHQYIPLATAKPELLHLFEAEAQKARKQQAIFVPAQVDKNVSFVMGKK